MDRKASDLISSGNAGKYRASNDDRIFSRSSVLSDPSKNRIHVGKKAAAAAMSPRAEKGAPANIALSEAEEGASGDALSKPIYSEAAVSVEDPAAVQPDNSASGGHGEAAAGATDRGRASDASSKAWEGGRRASRSRSRSRASSLGNQVAKRSSARNFESDSMEAVAEAVGRDRNGDMNSAQLKEEESDEESAERPAGRGRPRKNSIRGKRKRKGSTTSRNGMKNEVEDEENEGASKKKTRKRRGRSSSRTMSR